MAPQLGIHVDQHPIGGLPLAGMTRDGVTMIEVQILHRIEFYQTVSWAATVHLQTLGLDLYNYLYLQCDCMYAYTLFEVQGLPNKTIYVRDTDLPVWERAQKELGDSISSAFIDYLKERLERQKGVDMVRAMDTLLDEINATHNLDIERHPSWSPIILDANTVNIGYKLHQKRANPDRIMSLVVFPLDFEKTGQITLATRNRITAAVKNFWDGKCSERHRFVDTTK